MNAARFDATALRLAAPGLHAGGPLPASWLAALHHYSLDPGLAAEHRVGRITVPGLDAEVFAHLLLPHGVPRGSVIAVHGLFDHALLWRHQMRWAMDRSLAFCALDLPGHGLAMGPRAHVDSFSDYELALRAVVAAASDLLPRPHLGVGQSTGGAVLLKSRFDDLHDRGAPRWQPDDLVLLAPLIYPAGGPLHRPLADAFGNLLRARVGRFHRWFYANSSDPAFNRFQRDDDFLQVRALPVAWLQAMAEWTREFDAARPSADALCVVQGDRDRTVDARGNLRRLRTKFASLEEVLLRGARHNLMNELAHYRLQIEDTLGSTVRSARGLSQPSGKKRGTTAIVTRPPSTFMTMPTRRKSVNR